MRSLVPYLIAPLALVLFFSLKDTSRAVIADTKHNLSTSGTGTIKAVSEDEICVFCHTPHGASSELPLWNHTLSTQTYILPDNADPQWITLLTSVQQPDKGSRLCLSCHDGTVAIGSLVNMPGPGSIGSVTMQGVTGSGTMPNTATGYVGTDLSGTHPISVAVNDQLINDKNACNTGNSFLIQYPPGGDPVQLRPTDNTYSGNPGRQVTTPAGFVYNEGVQCTSCHDPHDDTNGDFLVKGTPANQSPLCNSCHFALCP